MKFLLTNHTNQKLEVWKHIKYNEYYVLSNKEYSCLFLFDYLSKIDHIDNFEEKRSVIQSNIDKILLISPIYDDIGKQVIKAPSYNVLTKEYKYFSSISLKNFNKEYWENNFVQLS